MHSKKLVLFQGQIETAMQKFRANLEPRVKKLFAMLHVKSPLTGADICKRVGCPLINLLFVLTNLVFVHIKTVHDLLDRPLKSPVQAQKDAFYRFKKAEWSWRAFLPGPSRLSGVAAAVHRGLF